MNLFDEFQNFSEPGNLDGRNQIDPDSRLFAHHNSTNAAFLHTPTNEGHDVRVSAGPSTVRYPPPQPQKQFQAHRPASFFSGSTASTLQAAANAARAPSSFRFFGYRPGQHGSVVTSWAGLSHLIGQDLYLEWRGFDTPQEAEHYAHGSVSASQTYKRHPDLLGVELIDLTSMPGTAPAPETKSANLPGPHQFQYANITIESPQ